MKPAGRAREPGVRGKGQGAASEMDAFGQVRRVVLPIGTPAFHVGNVGSNPAGDALFSQAVFAWVRSSTARGQ